MTRRVLIAGIGNVFLGDDAFGVEVAARLAEVRLPDGVEVMDVGIRGVHLAYQLMDGYDLLVLVDAVARGEAPGTVTVIAPSVPDAAEPLDPHRLEPAPLLASLRALGAMPERVLLVGCEPAILDEGMGLSAVVARAVDHAVAAVLELVDGLVGTNERGSGRDEEEGVPAPGAGPDRLRDLPPAARHRAHPPHQADVSV